MTNATQKPEVLAVDEREAGRLLGFSSRTVFSLRKAGKIRAVKVGTGPKCRVVYPVDELKRFLAAAGN